MGIWGYGYQHFHLNCAQLRLQPDENMQNFLLKVHIGESCYRSFDSSVSINLQYAGIIPCPHSFVVSALLVQIQGSWVQSNLGYFKLFISAIGLYLTIGSEIAGLNADSVLNDSFV